MKSRYIGLFLIITRVFYADTDEVKSVMEGDSVTLNPDLTKIQGLDLLLWRFGDEGSTIAQVDGNKISYENNKVFSGRLKLDQTGSLIITNIRSSHSGLYKAEIIHRDGTTYNKFNVSVYEPPSVLARDEADIKSVSVKEGVSVTLNVPQLQGNELIVWRFGDEGKLIAKHDKEAKSSPLFALEERFGDRLKLNQTGSLIITDTTSTDSGLYTVKISSNKQTFYKRFTVSVTEAGLSPAAVGGIVVLLLLLLLMAAAAGVYIYFRKRSELNNQKSEISERQKETLVISDNLKQMSQISTQLTQMTEDCVKELPGVSGHHQTERISEKLKKMSDASERLKQLSMCCEKDMREISERLKEMSLTKKVETSEQDKPLIEEVEIVEGLGADDTKEKTRRSEMEKGESERPMIVEDTPISQAVGGPRDADGRVRDKRGKSLLVRNPGTEHT